MTLPKVTFFAALCLLAVPAVFAAPAQTNVPGCSAAVADHATASRAQLIAGTDIFNGELLQTANDGGLIVQCNSVKLALAANGSMRIFQTGPTTSVELEGGIVAYSTAGRSEDLTIYGLDVKVVPDTRQATLGQVNMPSHCQLSVQSTKGTVAVTSAKETRVVEESKGYDVTPAFGVDYSEDWHPVPTDYPDFPREAKYHESHHHVACTAAPYQNTTPVHALGASQFHEMEIAGGLVGLGVLLWWKTGGGGGGESPFKP
jgi:hypothetical protein